MKRTYKILMIGLLVTTSAVGNAQIIDNYGIKIGVGLSNQYMKYIPMYSDLSDWKGNKIGFNGQFFAEKYLGKYFSFRPAIGYIQKGYTTEITLLNGTAEDFNFSKGDYIANFHNLSMDLTLKVMPLQKDIRPYLLIGLRGDYLLDHQSKIIEDNGVKHQTDSELSNSYNNFTLGGLLVVGISYNDLMFMDLEYNPSLTKNYESSSMAIYDRYFSLTLGMNINQLIKSRKD